MMALPKNHADSAASDAADMRRFDCADKLDNAE
jgi:hypothetical protein